MSTTPIAGATTYEQELYDHLVKHIDSEMSILQAYDASAKESDSPAYAYLVRLILEDEKRHHQLLRDLAETIRTSAELSGEPTPIPDLAMFRADRDRILDETARYLAFEEEDNRE